MRKYQIFTLLLLLFAVFAGAQQILSTSCKEGTNCKLTMTFYDQNGQPVNPKTVNYWVNEQSTKANLVTNQPIPTPTGTWTGTLDVVLPLCASRQVTARDKEDHIISVMVTDISGATTWTDYASYSNENVPAIAVQVKATPTGTINPLITPACIVTPYVTPTAVP